MHTNYCNASAGFLGIITMMTMHGVAFCVKITCMWNYFREKWHWILQGMGQWLQESENYVERLAFTSGSPLMNLPLPMSSDGYTLDRVVHSSACGKWLEALSRDQPVHARNWIIGLAFMYNLIKKKKQPGNQGLMTALHHHISKCDCLSNTRRWVMCKCLNYGFL